MVAFVMLKGPRPQHADAKKIAEHLRAWFGKEIGPVANPGKIRFGGSMPKTRSGKVVRRRLHSVATGDALAQDMSTVGNPAVLRQFSERA